MGHEDARVNQTVPPLNHAADHRLFFRVADERRAGRAACFGFGFVREGAEERAAFFASASASAACAAAKRAIGTR